MWKQKFIHRNDSSNADHIEFVTLYDSEDLRCYCVQDRTIVYKEKHKNNYNSIYIGAFENIAVDEKDKVLVPFANYMFFKGEWEWVRIFAEFLIKVNDSESIETLARYSKGQFSKQELQTNEYSAYTREDIQNFSMNVLKKFGLNKE